MAFRVIIRAFRWDQELVDWLLEEGLCLLTEDGRVIPDRHGFNVRFTSFGVLCDFQNLEDATHFKLMWG